MTILVGIHCDKYIQIAADTRSTSYSSDHFKDGECKISHFENGLITGTGFNVLLERVKEAFGNKKIENISSIKTIIKQEQEVLSEKILSYNKDHPLKQDVSFKEIIEGTSFLIGYKAKEGLKLFYVEYIKNKNISIEIKEGMSKISFPSNLDYNIFKQQEKIFNKNVNYEIENISLNENISTINNLIKELNKHTNSISRNFTLEIYEN